jgi:CheY-like chemotaxis protein
MSRGNLESILYVEDDTDIQTVAQIALEVVGGFQLKICSSGKESIGVAGSFKPDLLLLDVMMPEMDGPTTLEGLRKCPNTATTPVIFMTAKVQASEVSYYKSLGALGVIAKPFDPMKLAGQVQSLWDEI